MKTGLAIFDLDHTLLNGDSDFLWGQYLCDQGIVDRDSYEKENRRFYADYEAGSLDIHEFAAFSLKPLVDNDTKRMLQLRETFVSTMIEPIIAPAAAALLEKHRMQGDTLLIMTSTNRFITQPIADLLAVDDLLATEPEQIDGRYTGQIAGTPCFRNGKVTRLKEWLLEHGVQAGERWFYSDSHNDLPLLEAVEHPVAVNPDDELAKIALARGWPIISLDQLPELSESGINS